MVSTQPLWITPAGALSSPFPEQQPIAFTITAEIQDPLASALTYTLLGGNLPVGTATNPFRIVTNYLTNTGVIVGTPVEVNTETIYFFTVRVTDNVGNISDRTFSMSIYGPDSPVLLTPPGKILTTYDSLWVKRSLSYSNVDPSNPVTFRIVDGALPAGLQLGVDGTIQGYPVAPGYTYVNTGLQLVSSAARFNNTIYIVGNASPNIAVGQVITFEQNPYNVYAISALVYDINTDITIVTLGTELYKAVPVTSSIYRMGNTVNSAFTVQIDSPSGSSLPVHYSIDVINQATTPLVVPQRIPVILNSQPLTIIPSPQDPYYSYYVANNNLGNFSDDNFFAWKFVGYDFQNDAVTYSFDGLEQFGGIISSIRITDQGSGYLGAPKVTIIRDSSDSTGEGAKAVAVINDAGQVVAINITNPGLGYTAAPTIYIEPPVSGTVAAATSVLSASIQGDPNTGWVTGVIPNFGKTTGTFSIRVRVSKANNLSVFSQFYVFTLTIIGNIDTGIVWLTDSDLGTVDNGSISSLGVKAVSEADLGLEYRLTPFNTDTLYTGLYKRITLVVTLAPTSGPSLEVNAPGLGGYSLSVGMIAFDLPGSPVIVKLDYATDRITFSSEVNVTGLFLSTPIGYDTWLQAGALGTVLYSTNSINWQVINTSNPSNIKSLGYGPIGAIAADDSGRISYSLLGSYWTLSPSIALYGINKIMYVDWLGLYILICDHNSSYASGSINNIGIPNVIDAVDPNASDDFYDADFNNTTLVTSGQNGLRYMSVDGVNWTRTGSTETTNDLAAVYWSEDDGIWIAVGDHDTVLWTDDLSVDWNISPINTERDFTGIAFDGTYYYLSSTYGNIAKGTFTGSGFNWTIIIPEYSYNLYNISYDPIGRYMAGGALGIVLTSVDGVVWTSPTIESLPPNLSLLTSGALTGRISYNVDPELLPQGVTIPKSFNIQAYSVAYPTIAVVKNFTVKIYQRWERPFDTLYMTGLVSEEDKLLVSTILYDNDIIPNEVLFRPEDPYYGKAKSISYQHQYGVTASTAQEYINAITKNHYWRNVTLGEIKTAQARDTKGNVIYEVVYSAVIDNLVNNAGVSVSKQIQWPRPIPLSLGDWFTSRTDIFTSYEEINNQLYYTSLTIGYTTDLYPASLINMQEQIKDTLGQNTNKALLPLWMTSQQANGGTLGYVPAWVICYTLPGKSTIVQQNIQGLDFALNDINFRIDRFEVDKNPDYNWNPAAKEWGSHVTDIIITNPGYDYVNPPSVSFTGSCTTSAVARAVVNKATGQLTDIVILNPGTGYLEPPSIAVIGGGSVINVGVWYGQGYTTAPTVTITPPYIAGGIQATAVATISSDQYISNIIVTNGGTGYSVSHPPSVDITPPVANAIPWTPGLYVTAGQYLLNLYSYDYGPPTLRTIREYYYVQATSSGTLTSAYPYFTSGTGSAVVYGVDLVAAGYLYIGGPPSVSPGTGATAEVMISAPLPSGQPAPVPPDERDFYVLFPQKNILPTSTQEL